MVEGGWLERQVAPELWWSRKNLRWVRKMEMVMEKKMMKEKMMKLTMKMKKIKIKMKKEKKKKMMMMNKILQMTENKSW